jgi:ketosteroid isomerase-like protein
VCGEEADVNRDSVQVWLDNYIDAWRTYDPAKIGDLFSEDALYFFSPFDDPVRGRDAIVANWLEEPDAPNSWEASYSAVAVEGTVAVANGRTYYLNPDGSTAREFDNIFIIEFDADARCNRFREWFMERRNA